MDIDDILAEVDPAPPAVPAAAADLQALTRAWVNEKNAPELLAWPEDLMERVMERVRAQIALVEEQTGDMDPAVNFRLIIVQTELERVKFLVRSFLRTRLAKIDRHALHYLHAAPGAPTEPGQSSPAPGTAPSTSATPPLLSAAERAYATAHQAQLRTHYRAAFLAHFPPALQGLDDTAGGLAMVERPDAERAVVVRALADGGERVAVPGTEIDFRLRRGEVFVVRWSAVRAAVERGEAELL